MLSIGDLVRIKFTDIHGTVVGYIDMFDVCQEINNMLIVSINDSEEIRMFKQDSVEKVDKILH